jgi:hypothetical protein
MGELVQKRNSITYKFKDYRDGKISSVRGTSCLTKWWTPSKTLSLAEAIKNDLITNHSNNPPLPETIYNSIPQFHHVSH